VSKLVLSWIENKEEDAMNWTRTTDEPGWKNERLATKEKKDVGGLHAEKGRADASTLEVGIDCW